MAEKVKKQAGLSLIELVIAIAVLAIVVTAALPALQGFIQNHRATAQANGLVTAIQLARSEALKRNDTVTLCASDNGAACGGSWNNGWLVREDGGLELLQSWPALTGNAGFTNAGSLSAEIRFDSSGRTNLDAAETFQLEIDNCTREANRDIRLVPTGRVSVTRKPC